MPQPSDLPRWASTTDDNVTEPSSTLKDEGYEPGAEPAAEEHNWLWKKLYLWMVYLKDLVTEDLTWTGVQTFQGGVAVEDEPVNVTGADSAVGGPTLLYVQNGDYTGAGTGALVNPTVSSLGGNGGTANGGISLEGIGGSGATGGIGASVRGGVSTGASTLGASGAFCVGGTNSTSGLGGIGAELYGVDGTVSAGSGAQVTSGDLTAAGGSTHLNNALKTVQGDVYTSGAKSTRGQAASVEAAHEITPGLQKTGGVVYPASGIAVRNKTGWDSEAFLHDTYALEADEGQFIKMSALDSGTYAAGFDFTSYIRQGICSPMGFCTAACSIQVSSAGAGATVGFTSGTDVFNIDTVTHPSAQTISILFLNGYLGDHTYFCVAQSSTAFYSIGVTQSSAGIVLRIGDDAGGNMNLDTTVMTTTQIKIMCFGR